MHDTYLYKLVNWLLLTLYYSKYYYNYYIYYIYYTYCSCHYYYTTSPPYYTSMSGPYTNSHSPPPLQHPVPTHPAFIPEPPSTPNSPQGYLRYTSSPSNSNVPPANFYSQPGPGQNIPQGASYGPSQFHQFNPGQAPHGHQQPLPQGIDFAQWGVNPATAQFGMQLGQSAVAAGQEYVQKNVS